MNITKATNSQLSTTESKTNKQSKQAEQEQNHRYGDHLEGSQLGGEGEEWGKGTGIKKHNRQEQNR